MTVHHPMHSRRGLTKIEVAVTGGIAAILTGLTAAAVHKIRTAASKSSSVNNLKQIAMAAENYHDAWDRLPGNGSGGAVGLVDPQNGPLNPLHFQIVPYVEATSLYSIPQQATPDSPVRFRVYLELGRGRDGHIAGRPLTDYAVNLCALYGVGVVPTAENKTATLTLKDMTDGPANTILVGGKTLHPADYNTTDPALDDSFLNMAAGGTNRATARHTVGATTSPTLPPGLLPPGLMHPRAVRDADADAVPGVAADTFGGPYRDGTLFAFADGHVAFLRSGWLAPERAAGGPGPAVSVFRAALTPRGGESFDFE